MAWPYSINLRYVLVNETKLRIASNTSSFLQKEDSGHYQYMCGSRSFRQGGPGPEVVKLFSCSKSTEYEISTAHKKLMLKHKSCFKILRYCIYHAINC